MIIFQEYWNQGIGRRLLQLMELFATSAGICRIEAKVRANNDRGVALYLRSGLKIEGTREKGAFIHNEFVDEHFIAKLL